MSNIERDQLADFASDRAADWQQTAMDLRDLHKLALAENKALAEQLAGAVVLDDAAITRAADAIGALGTDRIGAEPYAAARAILDAARGQ